MKRRPVVKVLYCGGCNPEIDRSQLVKKVAMLMIKEASFSSTELPDLMLLVSGCAHGCLDDEDICSISCPSVSVQGNRIDCWPVGERDLAAVVVESIREVLTRV